MRNILLTIIGSLVVSACAVESTAERNDPESTSTESAVTEQAQVQIPPELVVDRSPRATCPFSNAATYNNGTCFVAMTCHDARFNCHPSFCTNGQCSGTALFIATSLCMQNCSPETDCSAGNFHPSC
jgi:hypothetical protein